MKNLQITNSSIRNIPFDVHSFHLIVVPFIYAPIQKIPTEKGLSTFYTCGVLGFRQLHLLPFIIIPF